MNSIRINSTTYSVPSSWNELTRSQLLRIIPLLQDDITEGKKIWALTAILLKAYKSIILSFLFYFRISDYHLAQISHKGFLKFLFSDEVNLTKNLLPTISYWKNWLQRVVLIGPADNLQYISFIEWARAENAYSAFLKAKDKEKHLNKLVAVLYRPKRTDLGSWFWRLFHSIEDHPDFGGDLRQKYNDPLVESRIKYIAKLPYAERFAVFLFYKSCRMQIINHPAFSQVFVKSDEGGKPQSGDVWMNILNQLTGDNWSNFKEFSYDDGRLVLWHLNELIKENEKTKEEIERMKNKK